MKCLVTGATGFLGTNIVYELLKDGWDVRAFGLPGSNSIYIKELPIELMYGDVTKFKDVEKAVNGCDSVIHVAGDTSWWKKRFELQREINVTGAVNVAKACLKSGVKRLIHTSTTDTLGYNSDGIADETWDQYNYAGTGYNYADTKREGEQQVLEYTNKGLEVVVIYPGSMIGPFDFTLQYGRLFFDLRDGKVPGCPKGGISFGHVTQVAKAHIAAIQKGESGQGYICAGENITYQALFQTIAEKFGKNAPGFIMPQSILVAYGYLLQTLSFITNKSPQIDPGVARYMSVKAYYDSSKAINTLGYQVIPVSKMIDDAYDWYIDNGYL
jgi:dihydroflavonol-4-reductase